MVCRSNNNGAETPGDQDVSNKGHAERESDICDGKGLNTVVKNVTARRQQDSEANNVHLEGYVGNVRRHPQHVFFDPQNYDTHNEDSAELQGKPLRPNMLKKISPPEIERANKDCMSTGLPRIMEQSLGPKTLSVGIGTCSTTTNDDVIVKLVPTIVSDESEFMADAEAVGLVHCTLVASEEQHEVFDNLILKPVYWREFKLRQQKGAKAAAFPALGARGGMVSLSGSMTPGMTHTSSTTTHPLQSPSYKHMMSLTMCFTSQSEGYLYHLPGHLR